MKRHTPPSRRLSLRFSRSVLMSAALTGLAAATVPAFAQNTWVPTGAGDWSLDANWSGGAVPVAADDVLFSNTFGTAGTVTLGANRVGNNLQFSNTAALTLTGGGTNRTLVLTGNTVVSGTANVIIGSGTSGHNVNLTTGTLTKNNLVDLDLVNANTIGNVFLNGGNTYARNANSLGTAGSGTIRLGDATGSAASQLRLTSINLAKPIVLGGTTGLLRLNNLGGGSLATFSGGVTGTNNLRIDSIISGGNGSTTFSTGAIDITGALTLVNSGTGTTSARTGTITIGSAITGSVTDVSVQNIAAGTAGAQTVVFDTSAKSYTGITSVSSKASLEVKGASSIPSTSAVNIAGGSFLLTGTAPDRVNNSAPVSLGGSGTSTISLTGTIDESFGVLTPVSGGVNVLDFGATAGSMRFADSGGALWTGNLQVWNWTDGTDHLFFGNTDAGLMASQASTVEFFTGAGTGSLGMGTMQPSGELTPVPEPALSTLLASLGVLTFCGRRRRN